MEQSDHEPHDQFGVQLVFVDAQVPDWQVPDVPLEVVQAVPSVFLVIVHDWDSAGLPDVAPQLFKSVHVLVCVPVAEFEQMLLYVASHEDHELHDQFEVHVGDTHAPSEHV